MADRTPPVSCPVCGDRLRLTRLGCRSCGTEISGDFQQCEFCALNAEERQTLRVFLASRGNMRELERHLGVSYPTARGRFDSLLARLGIERAQPAQDRMDLLEAVARGELPVEEAMDRLGGD
ncbi:MAG TPA: DUF2089 domain-containing protein [Solirubrobacterales bacterium]|nr:DUF2089 domain-containing protein [Solirubrobacterales bacterium]